MTKDELSVLLPGAGLIGIQAGTEAKYDNTLALDGSINGSAIQKGGRQVTMSGRWNINDGGQLCQELSADGGPKFGGCWFYYSLDNAYFFARSEAQESPLQPLEIKKR